MYRLVISPQAKKELKKIKKEFETPIKLAIEEIKEDPQVGKPLDRDLSGRLSYKVSMYRIIYKVNEEDKIVSIISAGHRSTVYHRFPISRLRCIGNTSKPGQ